jgi:hypothetical protein
MWRGGKESALRVPEGSFLLETQPEILREVYSFLRLKEALVLSHVHRQFNNASITTFFNAVSS